MAQTPKIVRCNFAELFPSLEQRKILFLPGQVVESQLTPDLSGVDLTLNPYRQGCPRENHRYEIQQMPPGTIPLHWHVVALEPHSVVIKPLDEQTVAVNPDLIANWDPRTFSSQGGKVSLGSRAIDQGRLIQSSEGFVLAFIAEPPPVRLPQHYLLWKRSPTVKTDSYPAQAIQLYGTGPSQWFAQRMVGY